MASLVSGRTTSLHFLSAANVSLTFKALRIRPRSTLKKHHTRHTIPQLETLLCQASYMRFPTEGLVQVLFGSLRALTAVGKQNCSTSSETRSVLLRNEHVVISLLRRTATACELHVCIEQQASRSKDAGVGSSRQCCGGSPPMPLSSLLRCCSHSLLSESSDSSSEPMCGSDSTPFCSASRASSSRQVSDMRP